MNLCVCMPPPQSPVSALLQYEAAHVLCLPELAPQGGIKLRNDKRWRRLWQQKREEGDHQLCVHAPRRCRWRWRW